MMILNYGIQCHCNHPLKWHQWFASDATEWPLHDCVVANCDCTQFRITFWTWLVYSFVRLAPEIQKGIRTVRLGLKKGRVEK